MSGVTLLAAWLDFLNLVEAVLRQCPAYGVERLFVDMNRVQQLIEPSMKALASLDPEQVEATAAGMPELMGQLTGQFQSIRENARVANERIGQLMADHGGSARSRDHCWPDVVAQCDPEDRRKEYEGLRYSDELHPVERAMTDGRSWQGNWKTRLYERVRERGFTSLTAFAEARSAIPMYALAQELGADDVVAVQLLGELLAEAEQRQQVTRFVRDVLVRELAEGLPDGWPAVLDEEALFSVAQALGCWIAYTPESHKERVRQARAALLANPPPPGWRPLGPDDQLLLTLLPDEEA